MDTEKETMLVSDWVVDVQRNMYVVVYKSLKVNMQG